MAKAPVSEIELFPSDRTTKVPFGDKKISIAELVATEEFRSLHPAFAENLLEMIRDNPSIGISPGGADRPEENVRALFYKNYKPLDKAVSFEEYDSNPKMYDRIKKGIIKWNPEDKRWYRRTGSKTYAVPGASWHTGGYAIDLYGNTELAGKISEKYNITQVRSTGETWHFQPSGVPTSKRMYELIKERFGVDAVETPLPKEILSWLDSEVASNVPRQPERVMKKLSTMVESWRDSGSFPSPKSVKMDGTVAPSKTMITAPVETSAQKRARQLTTTTTTEPNDIPDIQQSVTRSIPKPVPTTTTTTTTTVPPTTTTEAPAPTTTQPRATTTVAPTTTTEPEDVFVGKQQVSPSSPTQIPTTTTLAPRRSTTTTSAPQTTSTTMAPKTTETSTPTTTSPPTGSTLPGQVPIDQLVLSGATQSNYAGGVDPNYKPPTKQVLTDPSKPYTYTNQDWQILLSMPQSDVVAVQRYMMKAFPGFKPGSLGDKYDPKTIKQFKTALGRINQFAADPSASNGVDVRGKTTVEAIKAISAVPSLGTSGGAGSLQPYRLTSPEDLKAVFKKTSQATLGRTLGEGDLNRLVEAYQANELAYQKTIAQGGTAASAPDPTVFAVGKLEKDFGQEVDTQKMSSIFDAVDRALSGAGQ